VRKFFGPGNCRPRNQLAQTPDAFASLLNATKLSTASSLKSEDGHRPRVLLQGPVGHSMASPYRPAVRWAWARPPSNIQRCGSSGLNRIVRWSASIARAGQFEKPWTHPLKFQARAELGLSSRARSIAPRPVARSPAKITMAQPPIHSASGSSLPISIACRARRTPSAISSAEVRWPAHWNTRHQANKPAAGAHAGSNASALRNESIASRQPSGLYCRNCTRARRYRSQASRLSVGLRTARSISARRSLGSIAPTTLLATWSCSSKMSSSAPSKRSAQICAPLAVSISWPVMRTRSPALRTLPSST